MKRPELPTGALEQLLATRAPEVAAAVRSTFEDLRPCVRLETTRASAVPLRGRMLDRLLHRPLPAPVLPATESKFGGLPYVESQTSFDGWSFIGQIDFAAATRALTAQRAAIPDGMPAAGLLAVDLKVGTFGGRVRWYPDAAEAKALHAVQCDVVAKYEAKIDFRGSWSLRGLAWFDAVAKGDDELFELLNDLEVPGVDEDGHWGHKLFGHPNEVLNEHYGFTPLPGRSSSIRDYALVWRVDYDNAAGFAWGTNWIYVVVERSDLERGDFQNAIVTGANA
jgi:hypothetical protein